MNSAIEALVLHGPQVAAIWFVLLVLAGAALAGLAAPRGVRHPRQVRAWLLEMARERRRDADRRTAEADEARRYAEEITVAARRAVVTAQRRREQWDEAQLGVERAWQAYQAADERLARARRAAAFAPPYTVRTPTQYAEREQFLHRTATAACRRGELSIRQLGDALAHRNGWNPRLHPVEQELALARATADHLLAADRQASAAERTAWHASTVAAAAADTLRHEAVTAAARADRLSPLASTTRRQPSRAATGRPRLVLR